MDSYQVALSSEVLALKDAQIKADSKLRHILKIYQSTGHSEILNAEQEYLNTVEALQGMLGQGAPCWEVDVAMWSSYSEIYKSVTGVRPSPSVSRFEVAKWLEQNI